jgi:hypothetical protein
MPTIRQFISDVTNDLKALSIDSFIPPKFIYSKAQDITADFLKKDNSSNKLIYKLTDGWSELTCIDMEEVPVTQCPDLNLNICQKLMKSKYQIPSLFNSKFGGIIRSASSVTFDMFYELTNPRQWKAIQKRQDKDRSKRYFFFIDGYIYIPVDKKDNMQSPEQIRIDGYFKNKKEVDDFNIKGCVSCKSNCKKFLDYEMVIPSYLINDVKKEFLNQARVYLQIPSDDLPNLSSNEKTNQRAIG